MALDLQQLSPTPLSVVPALHLDDCPTWCEHEHLGEATDPGGFHHDSEVMWIPLVREVEPGVEATLFVSVSQHAGPQGPDGEPCVEVQDERHTVARLTPDEAVALSHALMEAAQVLTPQPPTSLRSGS